MKFSTTVLIAATAISSASAFSTAPLAVSRTSSLFSSTVEKEEVVNGIAESEKVEAEAAAEVATPEPATPETPKYQADIPKPGGTYPGAPTLNSVDKSKIQPGRFDSAEYSIAIPFLKRPTKLDGTHAGDFGFDPLGLTEEWDLYTMQEAEIRHARLAMLAVIGWPMSELLAPEWMLQDGRAPSVLNGFNPVSFLATVAIFGGLGFFEYKTSLRRTDNTKLGKIHHDDMSEVWKYGVAGDYDFDPLNFYESIGNDAYARKGLREVEISHGRSAMLGITAFAFWEALTGHAIVENSMFFHPNALLPALIAGYFAFGQFYEFDEESSDMFFRFKLSSEGEARMENLKMGLGIDRDDAEAGAGSPDLPDLSALSDLPEKLSAAATGLKAGIDKLQDSYMENVVQPGETKEYK